MPFQRIEEQDPIFENLRKNINLIGTTNIKKKLLEIEREREQQKRREDIQDYMKKLRIKQMLGGDRAPKITGADLGVLESLTASDVGIPEGETQIEREIALGRETPYLGGLPGVLEKIMPFGGKARQLGIREELGRREGRASETMAPYYQKFKEQFTGQPVSQEPEIETLIEEYQTTDDPVRLKELEDLLTEAGVSFQ